MERSAQRPHSMSHHDVVRALVFSQQPLVSVFAKLYDMTSGKPHVLEELEMHSTAKAASTGYIYEARWKSMKYKDSSVTQYAYEVSAVDSTKKVTEGSIRPFSADRRVTELRKTWKEFLVIGFVWEEAFKHSLKSKRTSCRWVRVFLMGFCGFLSFIHSFWVYAIAGAYGSFAVFASPGFAWLAPILMISAILQSSQCEKKK
ncbi:hypothetical protein L7F22_068955 [Adiantum nelumboides]|nr:hypothetical protein [Adiantum nelumboides]